jgi:hypothetical protein
MANEAVMKEKVGKVADLTPKTGAMKLAAKKPRPKGHPFGKVMVAKGGYC